MSSLRFYLDEDCQTWALIEALRASGVDVSFPNQAETTGSDDERQLLIAKEKERVIVTNNIQDFVPLHERWLAEKRPPHCGIVVFSQQRFSPGEVARRLVRMSSSLSRDEMRNRLEWLNSWGT